MIPTKKMSVLDRAREAFRWEQLRTLFVVNTAISFFMFGIIYFLGDRSSILRTLVFAFVYSWSIGTTGYFLTVSSGVLEFQRVWVRTLSFLGLMIVTGCGGTLIAFIPLVLFFHFERVLLVEALDLSRSRAQPCFILHQLVLNRRENQVFL